MNERLTLARQELLHEHTDRGDHSKTAVLKLLKLKGTEFLLSVGLPGLTEPERMSTQQHFPQPLVK